MSVVLTKFKLTKNGVEAEYTEYEQAEGVNLPTEVTKKIPNQPKDELLAAFDNLIPHLMMMSAYVDETKVDNPNDLLELPLAKMFKVTGLVMKDSGVTLIGRRTLPNKKVLNLVPPFFLWENPEGIDGYAFSFSFGSAVDLAATLAQEYLSGDRHNFGAQLSFDFDNPVPEE